MGAGTSVISGAYKVSDKAGIQAYVDTYVTATVSGASIFVIPSGGNTCYVGVLLQSPGVPR